jgi:DNA-binding transcriptional LysR family regulator
VRSLSLDQLRTLLEVVEGGSFSAAARRLNLTQPAISLQIRELERRFGLKLIERLGKQAHATVPGRELIEASRRVFRECDSIDATMRRFREGWIGRVRISMTLTSMVYRLPPILRQIRLDHPGIDLVITNTPTPTSVDNIIHNRIDLALVNLPVQKKQLKVTPLCGENMFAIFPAGTRNLPDVITPGDVAKHHLLVEQQTSAAYALVIGWLGSQNRQPMPLGTVEALKSAVASNLGMAIVPEVAIAAHSSDFVVRPLRPALSRTLALIEHRHKPNEPAIEIVRNALLALRENGSSQSREGSVAGLGTSSTRKKKGGRATKRSN